MSRTSMPGPAPFALALALVALLVTLSALVPGADAARADTPGTGDGDGPAAVFATVPPAPAAWAVVDGDSITAGGVAGADSQTRFLVGSLSKAVTAAVMLQLVDAGLVRLDDPVERHLTGFRPDDPDPVTVHELLTHTSGFRTADGMDAADDPTLSLAQRVEAADRLERGDASFVYSNLNYAIAGQVIEKVAGMPYAHAVATRLFAPLGMNASSADPAVAADVSSDGSLIAFGVPVPWTATTPRGAAPDGYIVSTAEDLGAFVQMLLRGGTTQDGTRVMDEESIRLLLTAHVDTADGAAAPGTDGYGYGWGIGTIGGVPFAAHGGNTATFTANAGLLPETGRGYVVLQAQNGWFYDLQAPSRGLLASLAVASDDPPIRVSTDAEKATTTALILVGIVTLSLAGFALASWLRGRRDRRASGPSRRTLRRATIDALSAATMIVVWFVGAGVAFTGRPFGLSIAFSASTELTALGLLLCVLFACRAVFSLTRNRTTANAQPSQKGPTQ